MQALPPRPAPDVRHRLVTLTLAALLGWSLLAALTLASSPGKVAAAQAGQVALSLVGSPFSEWLADEGRNRTGLRAKSRPATGSHDDEDDDAWPLAYRLLHSLTQSSAWSGSSVQASPVRPGNPRTSPASPRAPPVAA